MLAGRFLELAQKYPGDPAAVQALVFILTSAGDSPQAERGPRVAGVLSKNAVELLSRVFRASLLEQHFTQLQPWQVGIAVA